MYLLLRFYFNLPVFLIIEYKLKLFPHPRIPYTINALQLCAYIVRLLYVGTVYAAQQVDTALLLCPEVFVAYGPTLVKE
jgi:hypothetical protein